MELLPHFSWEHHHIPWKFPPHCDAACLLHRVCEANVVTNRSTSLGLGVCVVIFVRDLCLTPDFDQWILKNEWALEHVHSLKLTRPLKIGHPKRKRSYSNHPFSGVNSLLVLGSVFFSGFKSSFILGYQLVKFRGRYQPIKIRRESWKTLPVFLKLTASFYPWK